MTSAESEQRTAGVHEPKSGPEQICPEVTYFAVTLRDTHGKLERSFQSSFAGFPEGVGPGEGIELREASPVYPDKMIALWEGIGQDWMVVSDPVHLIRFLLLGGNALISEHLAREHFSDFVEPHLCISKGAGGFMRYRPDAPDLTVRSRRKQKQRIRDRDGHRCQLCGVQPTEDDQTKPEIHHIRPFSQDGPTVDPNLITLCRECNQALGQEFRPDLYWTTGGPINSATDSENPQAHQRSVENYRRRVAQMFKAQRNRG